MSKLGCWSGGVLVEWWGAEEGGDSFAPIPKGLRPPAQGCLALASKGGATLGNGCRLNQPQRGL
jgi:hypothetical protein